jgi:hypothetical protein
MWRRCFAACVVSLFAGSGVAQAAVLVQYGFGPDNFNKTLAPDVWDANLTATPVSSPSTTAGNTAVPHAPWWDGRGTTRPEWGNHLAMGMWDSHGYDNNAYFQFTLTAGSGYMLNLESFVFDIGLGDPGLHTVWYLHTSVDGMAQGEHIATKRILAEPVTDPNDPNTPTAVNYAFENEVIDLSAAKYQGLESITLRMYVDAVDWSTGAILDNLIVNGTVTLIPEPAALSLLGVGALALIRRRRAL